MKSITFKKKFPALLKSALLPLCSLPGVVLAETSAALTDAAQKAGGQGVLAENTLSDAGGLLRWFLSTVAVLAVIVVLAYILKKSRFVRLKNKGMQVTSSLALSPKEKVIILEVEGKRLLLGVSAQNINFLYDLTENGQQGEPGKSGSAADHVSFPEEFHSAVNKQQTAEPFAAAQAQCASEAEEIAEERAELEQRAEDFAALLEDEGAKPAQTPGTQVRSGRFSLRSRSRRGLKEEK